MRTRLVAAYTRVGLRRLRSNAKRRMTPPRPIGFDPVQSGNVLVRRLELGDQEAWSRSRRANERRMRPWWPEVADWSRATDEVAFCAHFDEFRRMDRRGTALPLAVVSNGALVGELLLWRIDDRRVSGEVGVWLSPEAHVGAHFLLACGMALDNVLLSAQVMRLEAPVVLGNNHPLKLLRLLGFRREGTLRRWRVSSDGQPHDYDMWALTREDWTARRVALRGLSSGGLAVDTTTAESGGRPTGPSLSESISG